MQISVSGKHLDIGSALQEHVREVLVPLVDKYFHEAIDSHVILSKNKGGISTDISVHIGKGLTIRGHALENEPYPSFEAAAHKLEAQLRKHKTKLRSHHTKQEKLGQELFTASHYVLSDNSSSASEDVSKESPATIGDSKESSAAPAIIAEMPSYIPRITLGDAVEYLDMSNAPVFIFKNSSGGSINIVYRREDGNIGWVDTSTTKK